MTGGDDGETALFTGTEQAKSDGDTGEVIPNGQDPLGGGDTLGIRAWVRDLTYREVHAFTVGFAPMFTGLLLLPFAAKAATIMLGAAATLTAAAITEKRVGNRALRYVVKEPHYYLGGEALAALLGVLVVGTVAAFTSVLGVVA